MPAQTFKAANVLKLEVENDPAGLYNLLPNPDGTDGGWGWITPIVGTTTRGGASLKFILGGGPPLNVYWTSEDMPIAAGQYAAAVLKATNDSGGSGVAHGIRINFEWIDATGTVISVSALSALAVIPASSAVVNVALGAQLAPASTVRFRLRFNLYDSAGGTTAPAGARTRWYEDTVAKASTSAALAGLAHILPLGWTNILGPTHEITINRDELDVELLTATVLDATLDPATTPRLRPGRKVRVMALDGATWKPLFVGKIYNAKVTYDLARTDAKRARIALSATGRTAAVAAVTRAAGYATIDDLRIVLEGCGVPWNVNGRTDSASYGIASVSSNPNASALDQVAITRDSVRGYAWVDRAGVLQAWDPGTLPATIAATLTESNYSELPVDYDTDRCINTVNLKYLRYNLATGETVEVPYGPYVDQASVDQWGVRSADFTVHGITESAANMAAYAAAVLAANGTPTVRVNEVTLPISVTADVAKALLDLYDLVTITNTASALNVNMRVTGIEHVIATDKWLTRLQFAANGGVAPPQQTPSPGAGAGAPTDTGWVTPTYGPGWADWSNTDNELVRCKKEGAKVIGRGLCRRTTGTSPLAFTLPANMRPTRQAWRFCNVNGSPGVCYITVFGDVTVYTAVPNGGFISFDFEFDQDQP